MEHSLKKLLVKGNKVEKIGEFDFSGSVLPS